MKDDFDDEDFTINMEDEERFTKWKSQETSVTQVNMEKWHTKIHLYYNLLAGIIRENNVENFVDIFILFF